MKLLSWWPFVRKSRLRESDESLSNACKELVARDGVIAAMQEDVFRLQQKLAQAQSMALRFQATVTPFIGDPLDSRMFARKVIREVTKSDSGVYYTAPSVSDPYHVVTPNGVEADFHHIGFELALSKDCCVEIVAANLAELLAQQILLRWQHQSALNRTFPPSSRTDHGKAEKPSDAHAR